MGKTETPVKSEKSFDKIESESLGKVNIVLHKARNLVNKDVIGKSDPYAVIKYGKIKSRTKTLKDTLEPEWNHVAEFDITNDKNQDLFIELFDEDVIKKDDSLGNTKFDLRHIINQKSVKKMWVPLTGGRNGQILLTIHFIPGTVDEEHAERLPTHQDPEPVVMKKMYDPGV